MTSESRVAIIAEAGVNHNGSLELAKRLVDVAVEAGADMVKFQTFRAEALVSRRAPKAEYQKQATGVEESQFGMLKKLELDDDAHVDLAAYCRSRGIEFLSTPFDLRSADFLIDTLGLTKLKISSGDLTNAPFLYALAKRRIPVIISTGMALLGDVEQALGLLAYGYLGGDSPSRAAFQRAYASDEARAILRSNVTLLHCTTEYPTAPRDVNLRAMAMLRDAFGLVTGYSDHSEGIAVPIAATAIGAAVVEKHFTLDRSMEGPDHKASLEPAELKAMIDGIRVVERALGRSAKIPSAGETANRDVACKSIVAIRPIRAGELLTADNIACMRPGTGLPPIHWWELLGTPASRDFTIDEGIVR